MTGATGFIGSHLVKHLRSAGWIVHTIARHNTVNWNKADSELATHLYRGGITDVTDAIERSRPDIVFHLASQFLAQHTPEQISPLIEANVLFGTQLLEAMTVGGVKSLVNAGTSWQYFHSDTNRAANLYAATKQAFEDILAYYVDAFGMQAITLALFDSYGPGDTRRKVLRLLLDCLRTGEELKMSPGDQLLDLVHVEDICAAFQHAAELLALPGQKSPAFYGVSGGERMNLREIVAKLEMVAGRSIPVVFGARPYRDREVMRLWTSLPLPGWRPRISLTKGFEELLREVAP